MDIENTVFLLPGPVKMHPRVLRAMGLPAINHRSAEFQAVLADVRELTRFLFQTAGHVAVLSGSGTAGLDAAVSGVLRRTEEVLCIVNGKFSERFYDLAKIYARPTPLEFEWGQPADPQHVASALEGKHFRAITVCHNETSTGLTNPLREIGAVAREHDALLIVDGITSVGGIEVRMDWGIEPRLERTARLGEATRAAARAMGLEMLPRRGYESNTVSAIRYPPGVDDRKFRGMLEEEQRTVVQGGQAQLKGKIFRIGHMGIVTLQDLDPEYF